VGVLEAFEHRKHQHHQTQGEESTATIGEDQYTEDNELEYTDPYCKLTYAQREDLVGRDVKDVKGE
jgi:hypothetical protein